MSWKDRKIKAVIFDLDGTLMDAYGSVTSSLNFAMKSSGLPSIDPDVIRRNVGWGDRHLIKRFAGEELADKVLDVYRKHHRTSLIAPGGVKFLPGARKLMTRLKKEGYRLAVATNRPTIYTHIALRRLGIQKNFHYILCGDKLERPKPAPDILTRILERFHLSPQEALYVGDMVIDAETGRAARVNTVTVTTGSSSLRQLRAERPYKIVTNIFDVVKVLDELEK